MFSTPTGLAKAVYMLEENRMKQKRNISGPPSVSAERCVPRLEVGGREPAHHFPDVPGKGGDDNSLKDNCGFPSISVKMLGIQVTEIQIRILEMEMKECLTIPRSYSSHFLSINIPEKF